MRAPALRRSLLLTALAALLLISAGCENDVDDSLNVLPQPLPDAEDEDVDASPADVDASACDCVEVGDWYRFDTLVIDSLDNQTRPHPVISILNGLWASDIGSSELTILIEVVAVDEATITIRAISGARLGTEGEVCWLDHTGETFELSRDGCTLSMTTPGSINIYAGTPTIPKNCGPDLTVNHAIPVGSVTLEAQLAPGCGALTDGVVDDATLAVADLRGLCSCNTVPGQLAEQCCENPADGCQAISSAFDDPEDLCDGCGVNYTNLLAQLEGFQSLQFNCVAGDGGEAVCLDASFSAVKMDAAPGACP